jgi:serine/threonine protein kinase
MKDDTRTFSGEQETVRRQGDTVPGGAGSPTELPLDPFPGEYALVGRLGEGFFGQVWLARELTPLARLVALKFLQFGGAPGRREQAFTALGNDARTLAGFNHPNIVQVYTWRQHPVHGPCLVLQYVEGGSLEARVQKAGPLPWALAARYVADVADGLRAVHARGIIHRDLKPANMLWDAARDEALLTDFGIAARLADPATVAGTIPYMAPEAFDGALSPALDVYGLAASLFWLITAETPFRARDAVLLIDEARRGLPSPDPRCAGLPAELERLIRAGLAFHPEDRPSLQAFARTLRGALNLLLADCLTLPESDAPAASTPVQLRLLVSRQTSPYQLEPIASSFRQPERFLRDFKRVPPAPGRVALHTGDRVHLEVVADQPGYVVVFNVGPTGNLNLLYPSDPQQPPAPLAANRPLPILDVELTLPAGRERVFALWTRAPLPLRLDELRSLVERGEVPTGGAYRATRDMVRVRQSMHGLRPEDRQAVVLELDHQ